MSLERVVAVKTLDKREGRRPLALRVRRAKRLEEEELRMEEMWVENERLEVRVTPRHVIWFTRGMLGMGGGRESLVLEVGFEKMISLDFCRFRVRLFISAQDSTLSSSWEVERMLLDGIIR